MSYSEAQHSVFEERCKNWVKELLNFYHEAGKIDDIYTNEALSGSHAAFIDGQNVTEAELVDAIVLMRRLRDALALDGQTTNLTTEDQTARMTPFLQ